LRWQTAPMTALSEAQPLTLKQALIASEAFHEKAKP